VAGSSPGAGVRQIAGGDREVASQQLAERFVVVTDDRGAPAVVGISSQSRAAIGCRLRDDGRNGGDRAATGAARYWAVR
jgi:hypothetical protein